MADVLYESLLRITYDPDGDLPIVLLDFEQDVAGEPRLDGGQLVQVVQYIRAKGVSTFGRGNESHVLVIPLVEETLSPLEAHNSLFRKRQTLPTSGNKDILVEVQEGDSFTLKSCTVGSWNGAIMEHLVEHALVIRFGEIETTSSSDLDNLPGGAAIPNVVYLWHQDETWNPSQLFYK